MADPCLASIRIFAFNFAPKGWAFCNGQLMPISQNTALFALLGTTFGGDGKSTFALPDMSGSVPMHFGQGSGLTEYILGEMSGVANLTLIQSEMPLHTHVAQCTSIGANNESPTDAVWTNVTPNGAMGAYATSPATPATMNFMALGVAGGSQPHNNMMPSLALNFCIALQGIFPARS